MNSIIIFGDSDDFYGTTWMFYFSSHGDKSERFSRIAWKSNLHKRLDFFL